MLRWLVLVVLLAMPSAAEAKAKVIMYGASWCGPCKILKSYLDEQRVRYDYRDIDQPQQRAAYRRDSGAGKGIPLLLIGRQRIRGANLDVIEGALAKAGLLKGPRRKRAARGQGQKYGGKSPAWWQRQFQQMKARIERLSGQVERLSKVAVDNVEQEQLEQLREKLAIAEESLALLENDASRVALPRKYRR